ncbi:hypothetical protein GIB67_024038 [Kingdonia uniflora]|uniref:Auxin-responsive protein n=1 Tax=Kingdonia uniflora TaxID=39325 RepID=A0A7J7LAR9_9MAGN|nr:hypothetical protein GIB67_024038 [Kingdonia uniflora]
MATPVKSADDAEGKLGSGCLYVKVSMDGAPYLRKVDLKTYSNYMGVDNAFQAKSFKLYSSRLYLFISVNEVELIYVLITINSGQCASHKVQGREGLSESRLMDLIHGSEYVLTYEDKDEDWMLVGDVPWE